MAGQLVEGVGDEVILFGAFFFLSLTIIGYLSLRRGGGAERRRDERDGSVRPEGEGLRRENGERTTETLQNPSPSLRAGEPVNTSGSNVRLRRFPQTQTDSDRVESKSDDSHTGNSRGGGGGVGGERQGEGVEEGVGGEREGAEEGVGGEREGEDEEGGTEEENRIPIRLLLHGSSHNRDSLNIQVPWSTTIEQIRSTYFQEELAENRPVRFIYCGRVLTEDGQSLQDLGISPNNAIHLHIGQPQPHQNTPNNNNYNMGQAPQGMQDLSFLFFPLIGLILAICWVSMFCFPHIFSLFTKVILFFLSLGYVVFGYASSQTTPTNT